jgi:ParB-like chromosome segregation protein Spo0J
MEHLFTPTHMRIGPEVPVIVLDHLSELQKRAYILVDNKLAENAIWDEEMLSVELQALAAEQFDLSLTGASHLVQQALGVIVSGIRRCIQVGCSHD